MSRSENSGMSDYHALPWQVTNERTFKRKRLDLKCSYCYNIGHLIDRCWQLYPEIKPRFAEQWGCRTLTAEHGVATTLDWFQVFFFVFLWIKELILWSRHLVFWSLRTLTSLSEILRQGTGCVKGRY
jgi:hypothetical protein